MTNLLLRFWMPLLALLLIAVAFLGGRLTSPTPPAEVVERVEYRDRVVTQEVVREVRAAAEVRYMDRVQRVEVVREVRPDGSSSERSVTTTGESVREAITSQAATEAAKSEVREVEVERQIRVEVRHDWRVSALAGADLRTVSMTAPPAWVLGGLVERRIVGPISLGAWGLSSGAAGLSLSLEF